MIIGTAGHVDHGKSALVEALTGKRMDRLAEERRRGITIELNFAPYRLADGRMAGLVDVPGHEDFVQHMVAGASGIDLVLLVIAADEGIMPQTREHLAIVQQLRIPFGLAVITKRDLVEPDWLELVMAEVSEWVGGSGIRFLPPVAVSARTGEGIEPLKSAIEAALGQANHRPVEDWFRMPVDRVFSVAGTGTVITGTTWAGQARIGDTLRLWPSGKEGRIRSIESFGTAAQQTTPGSRTAIGLAGLDREDVARGEVATLPTHGWQPTTALDVTLEPLPDAAAKLSERSRIRVHLGTAEVMARVYPKGGKGSGLGRLVLEAPLIARGGDRLVFRSFSPVTTIGGGRVVDPTPPKRGAGWPLHLMDESPSKRLEALVARRRWGASLSEVPLLLGVTAEAVDRIVRSSTLVLLGDRLISSDLMFHLKQEALGALKVWHQANPFDEGIPASTLRQSLGEALGSAALEALAESRIVERVDSAIRLPGFRPRPRASAEVVGGLVERIERDGLTAPTTEELERETGRRDIATLLKGVVPGGRLVAVAPDRFIAAAALSQFVEILREIGAQGSITPGALRERTGLSRKYLMPLLEWADSAGHTRRAGEGRTLVTRR